MQSSAKRCGMLASLAQARSELRGQAACHPHATVTNANSRQRKRSLRTRPRRRSRPSSGPAKTSSNSSSEGTGVAEFPCTANLTMNGPRSGDNSSGHVAQSNTAALRGPSFNPHTPRRQVKFTSFKEGALIGFPWNMLLSAVAVRTADCDCQTVTAGWALLYMC